MAYIAGNGNKNTLIGTAADDYLDGFGGNDILKAGGGHDTLDGGTGADAMYGGAGDDTYYVDNSGDDVIEGANAGDDEVIASITYALDANVEDLVLATGAGAINGGGNSLDNGIYGNGSANVLKGFGGDDMLDGGGGADTMYGGLGNDDYWVDNVGDTVSESADAGYDSVHTPFTTTLGANFELLHLTGSAAVNGTGNSLDNYLIGNSNQNILTGGLGDDWLNGGGGADTMIGGLGDDRYWINTAADVVTELENEGIDTVETTFSTTLGANLENLTLAYTAGAINGTGNELDNEIYGNGASNVLTGGGGNDFLHGGAGADTMMGGLGDDMYFVDDAGDSVVENADEGIDIVLTQYDHTLAANVENLSLTDGTAVNAVGNGLDNYLAGNSNNNVLMGHGGDDILFGQGGADTMIGGTGDDTFQVDSLSDVIVENAGEGTDTILAFISVTLGANGANVENLQLSDSAGDINGTGNDGNNVIEGNWDDNVLSGGAGDDIIDGGLGIDTMIGGEGSDTFYVHNTDDVVLDNSSSTLDTVRVSTTYTLAAGANVEVLETMDADGTDWISLTGNASTQHVIGNDGVNFLNSRWGNDTLTGNGGHDEFIFDTALDAAANVDTITDFTSGEDTIRLDSSVFTALTPLSGGFLNDYHFSVGFAGQDSDDFIVYDNGTGALFYDADGAGGAAATQFAQLTPGAPLQLFDIYIA
jgi:Ca2+-binding RTX toxin-like protein